MNSIYQRMFRFRIQSLMPTDQKRTALIRLIEPKAWTRLISKVCKVRKLRSCSVSTSSWEIHRLRLWVGSQLSGVEDLKKLLNPQSLLRLIWSLTWIEPLYKEVAVCRCRVLKQALFSFVKFINSLQFSSKDFQWEFLIKRLLFKRTQFRKLNNI